MPKRRRPKFCIVNGDSCECGRSGFAVKFCRRPLSSVRMAEIMEGLRVRASTSDTCARAQQQQISTETDVNETGA